MDFFFPHTHPPHANASKEMSEKALTTLLRLKDMRAAVPSKSPGQASLLPFQVSASARRMTENIAEACYQALLLHALHLSGHLLLQSQLPPFQKETTARRRQCDSLFSKPDYQRNSRLNFSFLIIESQMWPPPSRLLPMARMRCQLSQR